VTGIWRFQQAGAAKGLSNVPASCCVPAPPEEGMYASVAVNLNLDSQVRRD